MTRTIFLTAENPAYQKASEDYNIRANQELYERLVGLGAKVKPATFGVKSSGYEERSFAVTGLHVEAALALASMFGQSSILVSDIGIIDAKTRKVNPVRRVYTGAAALKQDAITNVGQYAPVAYDIDFDRSLPLEEFERKLRKVPARLKR